MNQEMQQYQSDDARITLDVRVENDTVWLTQAQMAILFDTTPQNITIHIRNVYSEKELDEFSTCKDFLQVRQEGSRIVNRRQRFYNLDMIISVGYRVRSVYATRFRMWATSILRNHLLTGCTLSQRMDRMERQLMIHDSHIQSLVQTALPPKQGIFFNGQIFDAYQFVSELIRSAKISIVLVDNYADDSVLTQLTKRSDDVSATVCVSRLTESFRLDIERHNRQYPPINVRVVPSVHDRFLLLDDTRLYTFGASFKDLGKKLFCFSLMESEAVVEAVKGMVESYADYTA